MPIETPSSSPSPDSHDLPLITLRSPAQLPDVPSSNSTAILQSAYKKNKLNVSRASFFKKRSKNREPRFKAEPTDIPLNSLSTEEQDTGSVWKAQWEQIKGVLIQGWGYVIKQWRKTRISKGIIDYWTMHIIYLYCLALCGAVIIFIGENSKELGSTEFINCFFLAMSAITGTGLTILPFHTSTRLSTIVCYVLMTIGSNIMLSIPPVLLRRYLYRQAHPMEFSTPNFTPDDPTSNLTRLENENTFEFTGRKMYQAMSETVSKFTPYMNEFKRLGSLSSLTNDEMNATISSKTEYHAAGLLLRLYIFYIIGFQMIGFLAIGSYAQFHSPTRLLLQNSNLNPWSWSLFHVSSCFYNSGFSLIPNSLQDLYDENVIIVTSTILAIFGNCLFPITLRWIIILMSKSKLFSKKTKKCTSFLIQHPRRASIHLFEDRETWILLLSWIAGNIIQVAFSLAFDMQRLPFLPFSQFKQIGIFFFQAFSNRTSGFYIVNLNLYSKVVQVIWVFIMLMDSYPLLLTIKYTGSSSEKKQNLPETSSPKEEKSLDLEVSTVAQGPKLYLGNIDDQILATSHPLTPSTIQKENELALTKPVELHDSTTNSIPLSSMEALKDIVESTDVLASASPTTPSQFVSQSNDDNDHLLKQWVLRDVSCIYLCMLMILIAETPWSEAGAPTDGLKIDLWVVLFEVTSTYSTVGLSLDQLANSSIASTFSSFSKFVMIITMLLGRTRSVPSTIDYSFAPPEEPAPKEQVFILSTTRDDEEEDFLSEEEEEEEEEDDDDENENENENEDTEKEVRKEEEKKENEVDDEVPKVSDGENLSIKKI